MNMVSDASGRSSATATIPARRSSSRRPIVQRRWLLALVDPLVVAGSLLLALALAPLTVGHVDLFWRLCGLAVPLTVGIFSFNGCYNTHVLTKRSATCSHALLGLAGVFFGILVAVYILQWGVLLSRTVMILWVPIAGTLLILIRMLLFAWQRSAMKSGYLGERIVLAGSWSSCLELANHLLKHHEFGLHPAAIVSDDSHEAGYPSKIILGRMADLVEVVEQLDADRVIICAGLGNHDLVDQTLSALMASAVPVEMAPDLGNLPVFCLRTNELGGRPLLVLAGSPLSEQAQALKWLEDKVLSCVFLVLASPIMLLVALAIKLTSPGPVFFVQERHGIGGRPIRVLKFRTMHHVNGPKTEAKQPTTARVFQTTSHDPVEAPFPQATGNDVRVSRLGHILRRTSLDELPQFINVLRGEMSLVGPRPHATQHNRHFSTEIVDLMRRHFVKPGITGLAQINGARGETRTTEDMRRRIDLDLEYIRTWSLWLDLRIIAMTIVKGFFNRQP